MPASSAATAGSAERARKLAAAAPLRQLCDPFAELRCRLRPPAGAHRRLRQTRATAAPAASALHSYPASISAALVTGSMFLADDDAWSASAERRARPGSLSSSTQFAPVQARDRRDEAEARARCRAASGFLPGARSASGRARGPRRECRDRGRRPRSTAPPAGSGPLRTVIALPGPDAREYLIALSMRLAIACPMSCRLARIVGPPATSTLKTKPASSATGLVEFGDVVARAAPRSNCSRLSCSGAGLEPRDQQQRVEGLDQFVGFLDRALEPFAVGVRRRADPRSAASAALRRRLSGVFRSCAMLSDTSRRPLISPSMRSSMALRFCASTSSSSPVPASGNAPRQVAVHDRAAGRRLISSMRVEHEAADRQSASQAQQRTAHRSRSETRAARCRQSGADPRHRARRPAASPPPISTGMATASRSLDGAAAPRRVANTPPAAWRRIPAAAGSGCRQPCCRVRRRGSRGRALRDATRAARRPAAALPAALAASRRMISASARSADQHLFGQHVVGLPEQRCRQARPATSTNSATAVAARRKALASENLGEPFRQGRHGSCIQRRARCAAAACRSSCRSWRAAARRARR